MSEVTPRVGVWIETRFWLKYIYDGGQVTPRVGVWIETLILSIS